MYNLTGRGVPALRPPSSRITRENVFLEILDRICRSGLAGRRRRVCRLARGPDRFAASGLRRKRRQRRSAAASTADMAGLASDRYDQRERGFLRWPRRRAQILSDSGTRVSGDVRREFARLKLFEG